MGGLLGWGWGGGCSDVPPRAGLVTKEATVGGFCNCTRGETAQIRTTRMPLCFRFSVLDSFISFSFIP